ncbi:MAG: hypothetical protein H0U77_00825 [Nocardioidaceae bacterium]|nr:hypothetical protein [Nocardioidaceae bacterium]
MATRVLLHLGLPKSGTTYLQDVVWGNRETLAQQGLLYPGQRRGLHRRASHAVQGRPGANVRAWERLLDEIRPWDGTALVSHESLGAASREQAARVLADLAPAETHLVVTARDFGALVPSVWQQRLKRGGTAPLDAFEVPADDGTMWSWRGLDPADVLDRWAPDIPPERVHLIVSPPAGSGDNLLWRRFATVCDVDPTSCELHHARANTSLGAPSAELLRRVVSELGPEFSTAEVSRYWVKRRLADPVLAPLGGARLALHPAALPALQARAERCIQRLRDAGYAVLGDLDELRPAPGRDHAAAGVAPPTDEELLDTATTALARLLASWRAESTGTGIDDPDDD